MSPEDRSCTVVRVSGSSRVRLAITIRRTIFPTRTRHYTHARRTEKTVFFSNSSRRRGVAGASGRLDVLNADRIRSTRDETRDEHSLRRRGSGRSSCRAAQTLTFDEFARANRYAHNGPGLAYSRRRRAGAAAFENNTARKLIFAINSPRSRFLRN